MCRMGDLGGHFVRTSFTVEIETAAAALSAIIGASEVLVHSDEVKDVVSASDTSEKVLSDHKDMDGVEEEFKQNTISSLTEVIRSLDNTLQKHMAVFALFTSAHELPLESDQPQVEPHSAAGTAPPPRRRESQRVVGVTGENQPNRLDVSRPDKVSVYIHVQFLKLGEIDTIHDRYAADVLVQSKWLEPLLDKAQLDASKEIAWESYWNPALYIENSYGDAVSKEITTYSVSHDVRGCATVCEKRRINGAFFEYMELNKFPFDNQDLTVTITTERNETEMEFVEDPRERCAINAHCFVDEQEWSLHEVVNTWKKTTVRVSQNVVYRHPGFSAACIASRRSGFFIWNILVVMVLICSLSFTTFTVEADLPQFRLQLSFILLLTTVTFKFVVTQSLPMISYLTYLDKYILTSMCILVGICVWHAIVNTVTSSMNDYWAMVADKIALGVLAAVYVGFNLFFAGLIIYLAKRRKSLGEKKDGITTDQPESPIPISVSPEFSRRLSTLNGLSVPPTLIQSDLLNNEGLLVSLGAASGAQRRMSVQVQNTYAPTQSYVKKSRASFSLARSSFHRRNSISPTND